MDDLLLHLEEKIRLILDKHTHLQGKQKVLAQSHNDVLQEKHRILDKQKQTIQKIQVLITQLKTHGNIL